MKSTTHSLRNEKGFTLVEMAIVLVIIGLILGAVIKGKDVLNSAKQKKFYTGFVKQWELSVASYYDRTGNLLGDGTENGGTGTKNGAFDWVRGRNFGNASGIDERLAAVGLEVPVSNTANSGQYSFTGVYSGNRTVELIFQSLTSANDGSRNNVLRFQTMPTDLAIALDTIIDGEADPQTGNFRIIPDTTATWPAADATVTVNTSFVIDLP